MQLPPASCLFFPLSSKQSPQHPVHEHPQHMPSLTVQDQVSHPNKIMGTITVLEYFTLYIFFDRRWEEKHSELNSTKHSLNLISEFLCKCSFDMLLLFPNSWTSPHVQGYIS
jgi:hypothetical protein